jgi:hypothetical protein
MKELSLGVQSIRVQAETRELRTNWNEEMLYDFQGVESLNFERELKQIASEFRAEKRKNSIKKIFHF